MAEGIERRYLGAVALVDSVTRGAVDRPLRVEAGPARLLRNRSGLYVLAAAPGLETHETRFEAPPGAPPLGSVTVRLTVEDPLGRYLPRVAAVALPRDPDPDRGDRPESLFRPVEVAVFAAPARPRSGNWSGVRVSVARPGADGARRPIRGALLRVVEVADGAVLGRGISDERGEGLVLVPGIPVTRFADGNGSDVPLAVGPVVTSETAARLEVVVEPGSPWPVDPERLEAHAAEWIRNADAPVALALRTGRFEQVTVEIDLTAGP
ncbi:MAG: hypothetical protein Kow0092_36250 [Deferrisomatales bacterium]